MTPLAWFRVACYAALAALLVLELHRWDDHVRGVEDAKLEAQDAKAAATRAKQEAAINRGAVNELAAARKRLTDLESQPVPDVRLRKPRAAAPDSSARVAAAVGTGSGPAGGGNGARVPDGSDLGPDLGPSLYLIADVAEALAIQNRALLARARGLASPAPAAAPSAEPPPTDRRRDRSLGGTASASALAVR